MKRFDLNDWLSDPAEPAARYRYLVDIAGLRPDSQEARAARAAIPTTGWGAEILGRQRPDGFWATRRHVYRPKYVSTNWNMLVLADLGAPGDHPKVRRGLDLMLEWFGLPRQPFGSKKYGPHHCVTGNTARMFIQLGRPDIPHVKRSLDWLADTQEEDGGWDCFARNKGTLDCWEALSAYAVLGVRKLSPKWKRSMERGAEFYLERRLLDEGPTRYAAWGSIHYSVHYYYDFLVGLELLTSLGYGDDRRLRPALALLKKKRRGDGTWAIDAIHPYVTRGHGPGTRSQVMKFVAETPKLVVEPLRKPSKWMTLRALGVLRRAGQ